MPQASSSRRRLHPPSGNFSGLFVPQDATRRKAAQVLARFDACMESFLELWTLHMQAAGYLSFTTARRDDCVTACRAFLQPVLRHAAMPQAVTFETLRDNADGWADALLQAGVRHYRRGISVGMYLGCFKTFIMALEDALALLPRLCPRIPADQIPAAVEFLRLHAHAFEVLWTDAGMREVAAMRQASECSPECSCQDELLRLLTLEKCRFENIFNSTSDGVLVMDEDCRVATANRSLRQYAGEGIEGKPVWEVLGLEGESREEFFRYYPIGQTVEVSPFGDGLFFRLSIASLGGVSLASAGEYLVLLTNITPQVLQREMMEEAIGRHASALLEEKRRLEELDITLRTVLSTIHAERDSRREDLSSHVRRLLLPALDRIGREQDAVARKAVIRLVRDSLLSAISGGGEERPHDGLSRLTLAELNVCRFIRAGHGTKEIARLLNISPETVQTHRRNIRRKLGLRGRETQLAVHLLHAGGKSASASSEDSSPSSSSPDGPADRVEAPTR